MERATKNLVGLTEHPLVTWMKEFMDSKVYPMFTYKNEAYGDSYTWDYNIMQIARRQFPDLYKTNPYKAAAKVCMTLKDKHEIALSKDFLCNESDSRVVDCLVYSLFIAKFQDDAIRYEMQKQNTQGTDVKGGTV